MGVSAAPTSRDPRSETSAGKARSRRAQRPDSAGRFSAAGGTMTKAGHLAKDAGLKPPRAPKMPEPLILIPARLGATRLPDKPLAEIAGEPMIVHTWRRAVEAGIGPVVVATDAPAIAEAVRAVGGRAVMTRAIMPSGSDRIHEAAESLDPEGRYDPVVNVQGDFPTIDPASVAAAVAPLADRAVDIATLVCVITREDERTNPNVVKMVGNRNSRPAASARFTSLARRRRRAKAAVPPHRRLRLSTPRAEAFRRSAPVAPGAARAAGAAPRPRGWPAHRCRPRG